MIERPFTNLVSWVRYLSRAEIPVLKRTAIDLAQLREQEEESNNVNGRQVASVILHDPLMTLRVLAYIETHRRSSQNADITTIDHAVMMIGVTPFFKHFEEMPLVEDSLKGHPQALIGLLHVITRARQAAQFARDWAVVRHDLDVDEITAAALLHDAAEILLWCFAPSLMMEIRSRQQQDRTLRSAAAQEAVLGTHMTELQLALAQALHLPPLLQQLMDDEHADLPRVRNVVYAVNLARHAAHGWDDPALPDDIAGINNLLGISRSSLLERIGRITHTVPNIPEALSVLATTALPDSAAPAPTQSK